MRAGLYERVSTGIQDVAESRSVDQQNREGLRAVQDHGWTVADRYPDPGLSASRYARRERPEWKRLLADIRAGKLDVVVMWASTRGSRELEDWAGFLNACRARGVKIYVTKDEYLYDLSNSRDWKELAREGIESASESDKISQQSRRGVADAAARGEPHGRIRYGYARRYEHDPSHPKKKRTIQYPDPVEAPIAKEIITRLARADSVTGIIRDLAARGVTTRAGLPWAHGTITHMVLTGEAYIGKRRHKGGPLLDGNWPPIVDEDVYWAAVTVLKDPARKTRAEERGGIRPGAAKWLLSYIATCDVCSAPLGLRNRSGVPYYKCGATQATHGYAPMEWVDWLMGEAVIRWCAQDHVYAEIVKGDDGGALAAQAEADTLQAELDEWLSSGISPRAYKLKEEQLLPAIAAAQERARTLAVPAELRELVGRDRREKDIAERWLDMPLTARRSVIRKVAAPTLRPTGRGGRLLEPRRFSPNFRIPMQTRDYSLDPLLPLPDCLTSRTSR